MIGADGEWSSEKMVRKHFQAIKSWSSQKLIILMGEKWNNNSVNCLTLIRKLTLFASNLYVFPIQGVKSQWVIKRGRIIYAIRFLCSLASLIKLQIRGKNTASSNLVVIDRLYMHLTYLLSRWNVSFRSESQIIKSHIRDLFISLY